MNPLVQFISGDLSLNAESKGLLDLAFGSSMSFALFDREGQCLLSNGKWENHIHATKEDLRHQNIREMLTTAPRRQESILQNIEEAFVSEQPRFDNLPNVLFKDSYSRFTLSFMPFRSTTQQLIAVGVYGYEKAEPESKLQLMADSLSALVSYVDRNLHYVFNNAYYEKWLGIPRDKVVGMHMRDVIGGDAFRWAEPFVRRTLAGVATRHEKLIRTLGGLRNIVAEYIPDCDENGGVRGFFIIAHDVTEQRRNELFLRDQQKRLRILSDSVPSAIAYVDRTFRYTFVNATYQLWFNRPVEEIVGQTVEDLLGPEAFAVRLPSLTRALNGETVRADYDLLCGTKKRYFDAKFIPDFDAQGHVRGIVCSLTDVTEFREATQLAEEAAHARDEFISIASHELKTPLTSLRLHEQTISRKIRMRGIESLGPVQVLEMLENSERQTNRLLRLVDDMLEMSRILHRKFVIRPETTELNRLVLDCLSRLRPQLDLTGCEVKCDLEVVFGSWDRYRVEQIVINLMTNAMKYGYGKPIHIRVFRRGTDVILEVEDHGVGIEASAIDRIFERFERAVPSAEISGLGMGLYISRELARAHGGDITVKSQLGDGAIFTVCLPQFSTPSAAPV